MGGRGRVSYVKVIVKSCSASSSNKTLNCTPGREVLRYTDWRRSESATADVGASALAATGYPLTHDWVGWINEREGVLCV